MLWLGARFDRSAPSASSRGGWASRKGILQCAPYRYVRPVWTPTPSTKCPSTACHKFLRPGSIAIQRRPGAIASSPSLSPSTISSSSCLHWTETMRSSVTGRSKGWRWIGGVPFSGITTSPPACGQRSDGGVSIDDAGHCTVHRCVHRSPGRPGEVRSPRRGRRGARIGNRERGRGVASGEVCVCVGDEGRGGVGLLSLTAR